MNDALTSVAVAAGQVDADLALGVREVIAKALGQSLDAVELRHNLVDELGAESLDFLDIVFALEDRFDVEITRGALEQAARGGMQDEEFAPDGVVSEAGLERLRSLLPEAAQRIEAGLRPREIPRLFSVLTFARVVAAQLESKPTSAEHAPLSPIASSPTSAPLIPRWSRRRRRTSPRRWSRPSV